MNSLRDRMFFVVTGLFLGVMATAHAATKIDAPLAQALNENPGELRTVLIRLHDDSARSALQLLAPGTDRPRQVTELLRTHADRTQAPLRTWLAAQNIASRSYWLGNLLRIEADAPTIKAIASRDDVVAVLWDRVWRQSLPSPQPQLRSGFDVQAIEASLSHIGAPQVWATGILGQDVVIAGQDTGYQWDHPALRVAYRGWDGVTADHNYNWHDAIHELIGGGVNSCGLDMPTPCDDHNHGTHTMGTMVGDDGNSNQIGIAPGARWIGCRNMEEGDGTPSTYTECFQWFIAPTALDGSDPDPDLAPHIINNSWGCPESEGCTEAEIALMQDVVEAVRAAGILVVASAGNSGSACGSIDAPPAIYTAAFTVGATTVPNDTIASFSSRGPVVGGLLKPDVTAPGVSIRSSVTGNFYASFNGTSMAGPHVAGTAALMMSVNPALRRNPGAVETILRETAVPITSAQSCGGFDGGLVPNAVFGHGRIDAWAAFRVAETIFAHDFE